MKAAILLGAILLTGCAMNLCPENLNLTQENHIPYNNLPGNLGVKAFDKSISHAGEVHRLAIYESTQGYYVRFEPLHFSAPRLYGPFNTSWREDLECK
jgi:hypothetical protein